MVRRGLANFVAVAGAVVIACSAAGPPDRLVSAVPSAVVATSAVIIAPSASPSARAPDPTALTIAPPASPSARTPDPTVVTIAPPASPSPRTPDPTPTCLRDGAGHVQFVDTHAFLDGITAGGPRYDAAADAAVRAADGSGSRLTILMPTPQLPGTLGGYDFEVLAPAVGAHAGRLAFMGGGGSLNVMIQEAVAAGGVNADLRRRFEDRAAQIIAAGAIGFGELASEHLSAYPRHPYESAPPDHTLFLLLADLAARFDVPILYHMKLVTSDMPTPPQYLSLSPLNPPSLRENLSGFERLLSHNPSARFVWAHAGGDAVGIFDAALAGRMLRDHPNLYLSLKLDVPGILAPTGVVRPDWLAVIRAFPDRTMVGTDDFHAAPGAITVFPRAASALPRIRAFLDTLPPELACGVGVDNAARVYKLKL